MTCNRTIQLKSRKLAVARLAVILPCVMSHVVMAAWLPSELGTEG